MGGVEGRVSMRGREGRVSMRGREGGKDGSFNQHTHTHWRAFTTDTGVSRG